MNPSDRADHFGRVTTFDGNAPWSRLDGPWENPDIDKSILQRYTETVGVLDEFFAGLEGFEWDEGNSEKTWRRHAVRQVEAEEALLNRPVVLALDVKHSHREPRFIALGRTDTSRRLTIVFTIGGNRVRVISARPMSAKERRIHAKIERSPEADS